MALQDSNIYGCCRWVMAAVGVMDLILTVETAPAVQLSMRRRRSLPLLSQFLEQPPEIFSSVRKPLSLSSLKQIASFGSLKLQLSL